jgi:tetratricopeptide (TPR) repeat protein
MISQVVFTKTTDSLLANYSRFSNLVESKRYDSAYYIGALLVNSKGIENYSAWFFPKYDEVIFGVLADSSITVLPKFITEFYISAKILDPNNKVSYLVREAFLLDKYFNRSFETIYPLYDSAMRITGKVEDLILQRISEKAGSANIKDSNTILNILDMYTYLLEKFPENEKWGNLISDLAQSEENLIKLRTKLFKLKPESRHNLWALISLLVEKDKFKEAFPLLQKITGEYPEEIKYWKTFTYTSEKLKDNENSLKGYLSLIKLDSGVKEYYFNAGVLYEKKDNYAAASKYFNKASVVAKGWGKALFYEGLVYENSARGCGELDFFDKCVYQLAYEKYLNALGYDPSLSEIQKRIEEIEKYLPESADFHKNGYKPGDKIKITGSCYNWIEEELIVQ